MYFWCVLPPHPNQLLFSLMQDVVPEIDDRVYSFIWRTYTSMKKTGEFLCAILITAGVAGQQSAANSTGFGTIDDCERGQVSLKAEHSLIDLVFDVVGVIFDTSGTVPRTPEGWAPGDLGRIVVESLIYRDSVVPVISSSQLVGIHIGTDSLQSTLKRLGVHRLRKSFPHVHHGDTIYYDSTRMRFKRMHDLSLFYRLEFPPDRNVDSAVISLRVVPGIILCQPVPILHPSWFDDEQPERMGSSIDSKANCDTIPGINRRTFPNMPTSTGGWFLSDINDASGRGGISVQCAWGLIPDDDLEEVCIGYCGPPPDQSHCDIHVENLGQNWNSGMSNYGTRFAGAVGAIGTNGLGSVGIAPGASIMTYADSGTIASIDILSRFGAEVVTFPYFASVPIDELLNAVENAYNRNTVIVCTAGNYGPIPRSYPGSYDDSLAPPLCLV